MNNTRHRQIARIIARLNVYRKAGLIDMATWGRLVAAVIGEFR